MDILNNKNYKGILIPNPNVQHPNHGDCLCVPHGGTAGRGFACRAETPSIRMKSSVTSQLHEKNPGLLGDVISNPTKKQINQCCSSMMLVPWPQSYALHLPSLSGNLYIRSPIVWRFCDGRRWVFVEQSAVVPRVIIFKLVLGDKIKALTVHANRSQPTGSLHRAF